ncbi:NADH-quinone oxidoreductase subunit J [Akkermansiaceae bacterium]|jgi:NADH-quinone oxidoreductase subunit J|nr:NADH-quinone oxidoreductase subunit J [Akkermansiaceae bacterium]MDB4382903.1 NADH-quinone oxidoreductase subunit J [Akkermansiaceae bacterium]MDB4488827.1 NADH-quinone oxidoreductase subunit J [Akkermansiaceae bacterium]MDB4502264.1 NADH-quinone oxidoreductase subunit J [Akkermansiaceae bacterium]MDB4509415.1 NADH-quinone oxidoreductase subunit J [Akkermansiaceae bacterium]
METLAFYLFAFLAVAGGILLVAFRNPVSSALSMVLSFVGLAGLFIGLNAYFVGIVQILVYAGAIMVLFIFIIMLLDLNDEKSIKFRSSSVVAGIVIPLLLVAQVLGVIQTGSQGGQNDFQEITTDSMKKSAEYFVQIDEDKEALPREEQSAIYKSLTHEKSPKLPDTNLIGHTIFKSYNYPLQVMGALLLVATIGVVILSKRSNKQAPADS